VQSQTRPICSIEQGRSGPLLICVCDESWFSAYHAPEFMLGVLISMQEKSEIRFLALGARRLSAARAHDPTTLAEGGVPRLAAAHANPQMRVPVTAVADACAVLSVRKPRLRSAPVAAHPLHRRVISGQYIQQSAQRRPSVAAPEANDPR
jgi:hypothetical protein